MSSMWNGPIGPVTIKTIQGESWVFPCLSSALKAATRAGLRIVEHFPSLLSPIEEIGRYSMGGRSAVLLDECGLIVPLWRIDEERAGLGDSLRPLYGALFRFRSFPHYDPEADFRKGPVPGIRRRRRGRCYRRVSTHAERRENVGLESDLRDLEDFPVRIKIRGRRKTIPTAWDDICLSRQGDSWKKYRKNRYKPKT